VNQRENSATPALDYSDVLPDFGKQFDLELIPAGGHAIVVPYLLDE
jgi:hypothetical protein